MMTSSLMEKLSRLLRLVSVMACLTAAASLGLFALNQTNGASAHQQAELIGAPGAPPTGTLSAPAHQSSPQRTLDDVTGYLARPFAGLSSSTDQWTLRATQTLLIWALYGAGLGYLARFIRVRA